MVIGYFRFCGLLSGKSSHSYFPAGDGVGAAAALRLIPLQCGNGLIISRVDDVSLAGMNIFDTANRIRGPVGTTVKLELVTPDHSQTNTVELTRRKLQL